MPAHQLASVVRKRWRRSSAPATESGGASSSSSASAGSMHITRLPSMVVGLDWRCVTPELGAGHPRRSPDRPRRGNCRTLPVQY